MYIALNTF